MDCDRSTFDDNKSALTQSSRSPDFQSCLGNVALETRFCEDSGQSTPFLLQQGFLLPCTLSGDLEHRDLPLDHKVAGWNISAGSSRLPRPRDRRSSSSRRHSCWFRTLASPGTRGPRCNPPLPQSRGRHLVEDGSSAPHHYKLSSTLAAPPERPSPPRRCLRLPTQSPSKIREELLKDTQLKLHLGQLAIGDGGRWLPAKRVATLLSDAKTRAVVKRFGHNGEVDSTWNMLCKVKYCFHFSPVHSVEVMFLVAMKRALVTFGFRN